MIAIFTCQKTGSNTFRRTLGQVLPRREFFNSHIVTNNGNLYSVDDDKIYLMSDVDFFISSVRDPISQYISWFFYNQRNFIRKINFEKLKNKKAILHLITYKLLKNYEYENIDRWFTDQYEKIFPIFNKDIDREQPYWIFNNKYFIIKLERLNDCYKSFFEDIYIPVPKLINHTKNTSKIYNFYLENMTIPKFLLEDVIKKSKVVKTFYSQEEIEKFIIKKWKKNLV